MTDPNAGGANSEQWCFAWFASTPVTPGQNRQGLADKNKWIRGDVITASFLDGDASVQQRVRAVAKQWTGPGLANLTLSFRDDTNDTMIRISFRYAGSWSVIGTTCKKILDLKQPTMNFGWLTPTSTDEEVQRVVLHEFGHALGLIHEHQVPNNGIQWDKPAVIRDLSGPPNNWTQDVIEHNMFEPYNELDTTYTALDPASIMMYPLPAKWTTNGFSVGLNGTLSPGDKSFIRQQYPGF